MKLPANFWDGVSWSAFSGKEMLSTRWYLRKERIILYNTTAMIGIAGQGAATFCMFKYMFLQNHIESLTAHVAHVHNNDIEAAGILSMVFSCLVLLVFNAEFFRMLFWQGFVQPAWYVKGKKAAAVFCTFGMGATVVISTVVVARRGAFITGVDAATQQQLTTLYFRPPLKYNTWPQNIVWVVLLWVAEMVAIASTALLLFAPDQEQDTEASTDGVSDAHMVNAQGSGTPEVDPTEDEKKTSNVSVLAGAV